MNTVAAQQGPILVRHRPPSAIRGLVAGIVGYTEHSDQPIVRRQVAGTLIPLVLSAGPALEVLDTSVGTGVGHHASFLAGIRPGHVTTSFESEQHCIQIYPTPLGAFRLLGLPGRELAARVIDVTDAAPVFGQSFLDELWSAQTWSRRFNLIDSTLLALLGVAPEPEPYVTWIWREIQLTGGRARIGDLVQQTGWSHRQVISRFTEQIGLGPKLASSVVRFERAMLALRHQLPADVAAQFGYSDQSHLVREVRRFAGWTPGILKEANPTTAYSAIGNDGDPSHEQGESRCPQSPIPGGTKK